MVGKYFGQRVNDWDVESAISQARRQNAKRYNPSDEGVLVAVECEDL